jgi:hypothetical protein
MPPILWEYPWLLPFLPSRTEKVKKFPPHWFSFVLYLFIAIHIYLMNDDFVLSPQQILQQQSCPLRLDESVRVISGVVYRQFRCCNLGGKWLTDQELEEVIFEGT